MALGFFRRRQKMVIIIMVVLMVSFMVGGYGVNMLFESNPNETEVADTRFGSITRGEWMTAGADIEVLESLGFGTNPYRAQQWPPEMAFMLIRRAESGPAMSFMLLLKEAQASGEIVSEQEVKGFFDTLGYADESTYKSVISSLRSGRGWTEKGIRQAVADWLRVFKAYNNAMVNCPPSETELQILCRDVREGIDLRVVRLMAEDFVKDVDEPKPADIQKQFETYRTVYPGQSGKALDMGFGYRQPGKAQVQYLLARGEVVTRVTTPTFNTLVDYYNSNKSEFYKEVPVTTAPAETAPADPNEPAPTKRIPLTFAQAKQQVIEKLRGPTASARLDELVSLVRQNLTRDLSAGVDPNEVYAKIVSDLAAPADAVLAKPLKGLKLESVPLDKAIERIALAAGIADICFPWGTHGDQTLLPSVKVTLVGDMTVRGALDDICRQVKFPRLEWATCQGFANVIFSVKRLGQGIDFFPITVADTELWTGRQFIEDRVLGSCVANPSGEGDRFVDAVFSAKGLSNNPREAVRVQLGGEGPRMYMLGESTSQLLWRLVKVAPAHVPQKMTPEIRQKIVSDLKLGVAMNLAVKKAELIRDAAKNIGLATAAENGKLDAFTTGIFTRKMFSRDMRSIRWSVVPNLDEIDTLALVSYFMPQAFKLMPENPDADANSPSQTKTIGVVPIPAKAEVLVIERNDYQPVQKQEYEDYWRLMMARSLNMQQYANMMGVWFNDRNIRIRTGYKSR